MNKLEYSDIEMNNFKQIVVYSYYINDNNI